MTKQETTKGSILILTSAILWGINGNIGAYLFKNQGITPEILTMYRLIVAGLILLSYDSIKNKKLNTEILKDKPSLIRLIFFGFCGILAMQYSYFVATKHSNSATATILQYLAPFIIVVITAIKDKKMPSKEIVLPLSLGMLGIFLFITHGKINQIVINESALFFGILAAIGLVIYNLAPAKLQEDYPIYQILGWGMLIPGISFAIVVNPLKVEISYKLITILGISYVAIFGTLISFFTYLIGVKLIGPQKSSIIALAEPVAAALIGAIFLKEKFKVYDYMGIALVIFGIFLLTNSDKKKQRKESTINNSLTIEEQ